jgi:glutathione peroxidase
MIDRRHFLSFAAGALATPALAQSKSTPNMSRVTAYAFSFPGLDGGEIKLVDFAGKPILIVNTASQCGYTPQFEGLQQLYTRYHARGLQVVAVPSNDFAQEPGDAHEIHATAKNYKATFPFAAKTVIRGPDRHPFYRWASIERPADLPSWNFHKYLVGRDGHIARVFSTQVEPMDARVIDAVVKELGTTG